MAKLIMEALGGKGKVALLTGVPGAPNLEERIVGVQETFKKEAPGMEIISIQACYDDAAKAIEILESFTDANPELDGWIGIGGWPFFSPLGTMPILEERAKEQGLVVVSFDTLKEELAYIEAGVIYGLVGQKYYGWGYESGKIMWDIAVEGKKYADPIVDSGLDVVTMDGGPGRISVKEMYEKWETGKF
jgi:ribose transport system substrate-binding protein